MSRGEFSIVIAGLAVTAGIEPGLGPLATAYVLILVVTGPLAARYTQPAVERLGTVFARRRGAAWAPEARPGGTAAAAPTAAGVLPAQGSGVEPVEDAPDAEDVLDPGPDQALDGLSR